jgi:hypothetical protein
MQRIAKQIDYNYDKLITTLNSKANVSDISTSSIANALATVSNKTTDPNQLIKLYKDTSNATQLDLNYNSLVSTLNSYAYKNFTPQSKYFADTTMNGTSTYNKLGDLIIPAGTTQGTSIRIQIIQCSQYVSTGGNDRDL